MDKKLKNTKNRPYKLPKLRQFYYLIFIFIGYVLLKNSQYSQIGKYVIVITIFAFCFEMFKEGIKYKRISLFTPETGGFTFWKGRGLIFGFIFYLLFLALILSLFIFGIYNLEIIAGLLFSMALMCILGVIK